MNRTVLTMALGLCLSTTIHAENITFADTNVKALCLAQWDTGGDGELSKEEAAAVTTLGTVFRGNKKIKKFEELKYFTGLTTINAYAFYQSSIESVAFPETVTAIGEYAFCESNLTDELRISGTVKEIGDYAFNNCKYMTRVIMEEGVERIGWHSFSGHLDTFSLPSTLNYMNSLAVDPYINSSGSSLPEGDYLYVYAHSATPANIDDFAFYCVFAEGHLVVPMGCMEAYKSASAWSHFGEYLELGDVNRDGSLDQTDVALIEDVVNGNENGNVNKDIADINGDGVVNETDINLLKEYLGSTTAITEAETATGTEDGATYNLAGQRVDSSYRGLVIRNGRKYVQR